MSFSAAPTSAPPPAPPPNIKIPPPAPVTGGMPIGKPLGMGGMSVSKILSGGMPCKFELPMEFFTLFVFTFIIYFCVFAFIPYNGIVEKILGYIKTVTDKFFKFLKMLIPSPVKKAASKIFPSFIVKYFTESIPQMIEREKEKLMTSLEIKLKHLKEETDKKLKNQKKMLENDNSYITKTKVYFNEKYIYIKAKLMYAWETFKDKIVPAIIVSFIYYFIWVIICKVIPAILKYLINAAQQFKQP